MNLEQILKRMNEIETEMKRDGADIDALNKEMDTLIAERKRLDSEASNEQKRQALLEKIANQNVGVKIRSFINEDEKNSVKSVEAYLESDEYRSAFVKEILGYEMNDEERKAFDAVQRAFVHTTENTSAVVPKNLQNAIYSQMEESHPILSDVTILRTGTVMTFVKHTTIDAGDAKNVAEGVANDDEQNTFVNVEITGQDISKHVDYSYRLGKMAIPAFETYLIKEIGDRIGSQWTKNIIAQIKKDLHADNKITVATTGTLALTDVTKALGKTKGVTRLVVYANNTTYYNNIVTLKGAEGQQAYIPNYADGLSGALLGNGIKQEDALADGEILILDPSKYMENVVQDLLIERDKDIKKHVHTISGIVISGGTMLNDKAGALITVGVGA